jgi:hypothetical protein
MQLMQTPSLVISHMHIPIVRLQQQTMAPFIMQQTLHFELAIMEQRFCNMLQAILSSQMQVIFIPPVHFSIFMVQRGIIMPVIAGFIVGMFAPIPDIIPVIGFIVAVVMSNSLVLISAFSGPPWPPGNAEKLFALSVLKHNKICGPGNFDPIWGYSLLV